MNISRPQWKRYANTTTNRQNKTINRKALRRIDHTIQRTANDSINRFWLSTTATFDRDGCSPTICTPFRKRHRMFTAWPHLTGAPHDFQLTHALLQRKNPCLCSGEHVWKDTTWSCRTLVVPGRPWEKPPFFSTNIATKYKYWSDTRPADIWMALLIFDKCLKKNWTLSCRRPKSISAKEIAGRDTRQLWLACLECSSRSIKFKTTTLSEEH